jgi:di/tricarboxylate transporter
MKPSRWHTIRKTTLVLIGLTICYLGYLVSFKDTIAAIVPIIVLVVAGCLLLPKHPTINDRLEVPAPPKGYRKRKKERA